jgi:hypothetical protein
MISLFFIRIKTFLASQRGEVGVWPVLGGLLICVAYLLYPEPFHNFINFILDSVFDSLNEAFGTKDEVDFNSKGTQEVNPGSSGKDR